MSAEQVQSIGSYPRPVDLIEIANRTRHQPSSGKAEEGTFRQMFSAELAQVHDITFSRHAHERMHSRGLALSEECLAKLAGAIDRAQSKGSKETLVLTDEAAFVVAVKNRSVVTVFDRDNLRDGVVTSIDSAVIV